MRPVSKKRRNQMGSRKAARDDVLRRDRRCRAALIAPGPCGTRPGRYDLEVHELTRGAGRGSAWLNPDLCIAVCPAHHDWITTNPKEAIQLGLAVSAFQPKEPA